MHPNRPKVENVDEYIALFPAPTRKVLQRVRKMIKNHAPEAEEMISYAIPTYKINNHPVIYFSGYEKHISLYPLPKNPSPRLAEQMASHIAGKGTLHFSLDEPLPLDLMEKIIRQMFNEAKQ